MLIGIFSEITPSHLISSHIGKIGFIWEADLNFFLAAIRLVLWAQKNILNTFLVTFFFLIVNYLCM